MDRTIPTSAGEREILGFVSVDSGQVMIADPCYVDSHWTKRELDETSVFRRLYRHRDTGVELQYQRDFANYQTPIPSQGGLCMNELNATGEWEQVPNPRVIGLSYAAACSATLGDGDGQLVAPCSGMATGRHFAVGVASNTGYGDGIYPVVAERSPDGRIARLVIDFLIDESEFGEDEQEQLRDMENEMIDEVVSSSDQDDLKKAA